MSSATYDGGNVILDRLPASDLEQLRPYLSVTTEDESTVTWQRAQTIGDVHFPIDGIYSIVVELGGGEAFEVGVVGRDGIVGAEIAIGADVAARSVICQAAGRVASLPADRFRAALRKSDELRTGAWESLRHQWFMSQQTVACNSAHSIEQRIARWVMMTADALGRTPFPLRFEFLQMMVGGDVAAIRSTMANLATIGAMAYDDEYVTIGEIGILRDMACECYERQPDDPIVGPVRYRTESDQRGW